MKHPTLLFSIFLVCAAAFGEIKQIGPEGGFIRKIEPDRKTPGLFFVLNAANEYAVPVLYRTTNGGAQWKSVLDNTVDVVVHPLTSEVFALTSVSQAQRILWKSIDQGRIFTRIASLDFPITHLRLNPADPNILFGFGLGIRDLVISRDGGRNWRHIKNLPYRINQDMDEEGCYVYGYDFRDLIVPPFATDTVYASVFVELGLRGCSLTDCDDCGGFHMLMRSPDSGRTWSVLEDGFTGKANRYYFFSDPLFPERFFLSGTDFYKSFLNLAAPEGIKEVYNGSRVVQVAAVPKQPEQVLAIGRTIYDGSQNLLLGNNFGQTWRMTQLDLTKFTSLKVAADHHDTWLAGTAGAGIILHNKRIGWETANRGFPKLKSLSEIEASPDRLYAIVESGYLSNLLFQSRDGGNNWEVVPYFLLHAGPVYNLKIDPSSSSHVVANFNAPYVGTDVVESTDDGKTWKTTFKNFRFQAFDPLTRNRIYLSRHKTLYASNTSEREPRRIKSFPEILYKVIPSKRQPGEGIILAEWTLFHFTNHGNEAQQINLIADFQPYDAVELPAPGTFLLVGHEKIYRTMDNGRHWKLVANLPYADWKIVSADLLGKHFFVVGSRMFETTDSGLHWTDVANRFVNGNGYVYDMTDPQMPVYYVATSRGLLQVSEINGAKTAVNGVAP